MTSKSVVEISVLPTAAINLLRGEDAGYRDSSYGIRKIGKSKLARAGIGYSL
jgi:hypothetical protein